MKESYIEIEVRDTSVDSIAKVCKNFLLDVCENFDFHIRSATHGLDFIFKRYDGTGFIIQCEVIKNVRET